MNTKLYVKRFDTGATVDLSEDFTLPDYQPEMRRVIGVRATPTVDGKYLSGDELEADGGVTYTVLYMDGTGQISQASQTSSYTGHIPLKTDDDLYGAGDIVLSANVENVNCRVTAPRRFSLSSRVRMSVMSQRAADCELKVGEGGDISSVRRKSESHRAACLAEIRKPAEAEGTVREQAGTRVVMAQGEVALSDVRMSQAGKNEAVVKGDAYVSMLIETPDGTYVTSRGRAPVEEIIPLPENTADKIRPAAFANVVMIELEVAEDGGITWRMEYDIDCDIIKCTDAEVTKDAYIAGGEDRLVLSDFMSYTPAAAINGRLTVSGEMKTRPDMTYLTSWGSGSVDKCETENGRLKINGSARITVITIGGGEAATDDVIIPIKYECDCADGVGNYDDAALLKRTSVTVPEISVREDGEKLALTAELSIAAVMLGSEQITAATSIIPVPQSCESTTDEKAMIRVYVPDDGETPWDVEKKFRLPTEAKQEGKLYVI